VTVTARYVIIGAGAAGTSAAERLRECDRDAEIIIVCKEKSLPISPVALPDYIEGCISKKNVFIWRNSFVKKNKIQLCTGWGAKQILQRERRLILDSGESLAYDKLLIASGASPVVSNELTGRKNVFTLRTLQDAEAIRDRIKERAVVYGAGAVAVKISVALRRIGIDVVMLCRSKVLRRLFDHDISDGIDDLLVANGVKIVGSCELKSHANEPADTVLIGGEELRYDGIIVAMGVVPNTSFIDPNAIRLGSANGIAVDDKMETSFPGIFAAGDCAETLDISSGKRYVMALWPPAVEQGRVAAMNMVGMSSTYGGTLPSNAINVFGKTFVTMGSLDGQKTDIKKGDNLIRFTVREGSITGCQMAGNAENAGIIASCIREGFSVKDLKSLGLFPFGKIEAISSRLAESAGVRMGE
jgi:NADPH-dependent 2,4-dienoyl-CoA reductase/sulfur reductase-like enzyme